MSTYLRAIPIYSTQGRQSATLPQGWRPAPKVPALNALVVVCHGWNNPKRERAPKQPAKPGYWLAPLYRWARPVARGRYVTLMGNL